MLRIIIASIILQFFCNKAFAGTYVSTTDIVKEIEKTLLFDKESREKIDVYQKKSVSKGSITLDKSSPESADKDSFDIMVVNPKSNNFNLREKEKLAYNFSLVSQYEAAIELYKKVLAEEPKNEYVKFSLAVVYQKIGQLRQAKNLYYDLLKQSPSNREEIVSNLISILIEESPKDSIYLLSRLSTQNPDSAFIMAQTAVAYNKVKNYDQAVSYLKKAIELDSERVDYKYNLAIIYDQAEKYPEAVSMYNDVLSHYKDSDQQLPIEQIEKRIQVINNS